MIRPLLILLTMLLCCSCRSEKTTASEAALKVISYNVRYTGEPATDGENHWSYRRHASINMVREERPAVIGTQEVLAEQLEFLRENLSEYEAVGVGRDDGASAGEHMAIFYRKEAVEMVDWGTFWLSETPDSPTMGWDAACYRTCTWARLRDRASGKEFALMNTHLDHVGQLARENSIRLLMQRMAELVGDDIPVVMTGDFNSTTDQPIYAPLKAAMQDAREVATVSDPRPTFNGWGRGNSVIDHIFVRGVEVDRFEVLCDKNYGAPYISDHYPVAAEIRF